VVAEISVVPLANTPVDMPATCEVLALVHEVLVLCPAAEVLGKPLVTFCVIVAHVLLTSVWPSPVVDALEGDCVNVTVEP